MVCSCRQVRYPRGNKIDTFTKELPEGGLITPDWQASAKKIATIRSCQKEGGQMQRFAAINLPTERQECKERLWRTCHKADTLAKSVKHMPLGCCPGVAKNCY